MRHCSAVIAVGPKFCSAVTFRQVGTGIPTGTRVRLQCPLVERGLKGVYKRVLGQQDLSSFPLMISTKEAHFKKTLFLMEQVFSSVCPAMTVKFCSYSNKSRPGFQTVCSPAL